MSTTNELFEKRVNVLDKGWIELQDMMGDDLAIVNAARVSFLGETQGGEQDKKLLFYLLKHRHTTPFEQVEFKFRVGAPVLVWWQWVRHRTFHFQSVNAQSGRYTEFDEDDFYVPDVWRQQARRAVRTMRQIRLKSTRRVPTRCSARASSRSHPTIR